MTQLVNHIYTTNAIEAALSADILGTIMYAISSSHHHSKWKTIVEYAVEALSSIAEHFSAESLSIHYSALMPPLINVVQYLLSSKCEELCVDTLGAVNLTVAHDSFACFCH